MDIANYTLEDCSFDCPITGVNSTNPENLYYNTSDQNGTVVQAHSTKVSIFVDFMPLGMIILFICIFGLIGNFLCILVLSRFKTKSTFTLISLVLAICDTVYLFTKLFRFGLTSTFDYFQMASGYNDIFILVIGPYIRAVNFIAQSCSTYITMAVALDRYMVISMPLKSRKIWTRKKAKWAIFGMILFANIYNIPRWFEFETVKNLNPDTKSTFYKMETTALRKDPVYKLYYIFWGYLFVMNLIPFGILSYFNFSIWFAIQKANKTRNQMSSQQKQENSFGLMLISVVIVFLLCSAGFFATDLLGYFKISYPEILEQFANVSLTLNFSVNFILYYGIGSNFRKEFFRMCWDILEWVNRVFGTKFKINFLEKQSKKQSTVSKSISTTSSAKNKSTTTINTIIDSKI